MEFKYELMGYTPVDGTPGLDFITYDGKIVGQVYESETKVAFFIRTDYFASLMNSSGDTFTVTRGTRDAASMEICEEYLSREYDHAIAARKRIEDQEFVLASMKARANTFREQQERSEPRATIKLMEEVIEQMDKDYEFFSRIGDATHPAVYFKVKKKIEELEEIELRE